MAKLRKTLGSIDSLYLASLMRLMEQQSKETIAKWCIGYCREHILPIYDKFNPGDDRPKRALDAACDWFLGKKKLPEVKNIILNECHAAAREQINPAAESAARACGQVASCFHVPSHALGLVFYGTAALAYDRIGLEQSAQTYEGFAAAECLKMEMALKSIAVTDEANKANLKWNTKKT